MRAFVGAQSRRRGTTTWNVPLRQTLPSLSGLSLFQSSAVGLHRFGMPVRCPAAGVACQLQGWRSARRGPCVISVASVARRGALCEVRLPPRAVAGGEHPASGALTAARQRGACGTCRTGRCAAGLAAPQHPSHRTLATPATAPHPASRRRTPAAQCPPPFLTCCALPKPTPNLQAGRKQRGSSR